MGRDSKERKGLRERHDLRKRHDLREEIRLSKRKGTWAMILLSAAVLMLGLSACSPRREQTARGMVQMGMERRDWAEAMRKG